MIIPIEKTSDRIYLKIGYSPSLQDRCKRVGGGRISLAKGVCFYPLDWATLLALRAEFGDSLQIGPELRKWAKGARSKDAEMRNLSAANDAELIRVPEVSPGLASAMSARRYQRVGAKYIADGRRVIIADQPGMGKTLETIGAMIEADVIGPILVFCPATAIDATWARELHRWVPEDLVHPISGTKRQRERKLDEALFNAEMHSASRAWIICNIEMARVWVGDICPDGSCKADRGRGAREKEEAKICPNLKRHVKTKEPQYPMLFDSEQLPWAAVIVDESHKSLVCHAATLKKMTQQRVGMALIPLRESGLRVALSGTPWRGKAKNFWGTLNWLRPEIYTSYWRWAEKWFDIDDDGFGKTVSDSPRPGLADSFAEGMRTIMLRRTKAECIKDLPPKQYIDVILPLTSRQKNIYDGVVSDAVVGLGEPGPSLVSGVLHEIGLLRQIATCPGKIDRRVDTSGETRFRFIPDLPSNKINWIIDFLAERGIEKDPTGDSKVVIASQSTSVINLLTSELEVRGIICRVLTGETKHSVRARIIAEFQDETGPDAPRVFILNTTAGGTSVTLDVADELVFIDETWIPDDQEQVEDRVHRASRNHNVTIYRLISEDTIEEKIFKQNILLDDIQKTLMDKTRGVEFARQLLEGL